MWADVVAHRDAMTASGRFDRRRREQRLSWMWALAREDVLRAFREDPGVASLVDGVSARVAEDRMSPAAAADALLAAWRR